MNAKKRKIIQELVFNIVFCLAAAAFFVYSLRYSAIKETTLGTGTFPRIILTLLMFFSVVNLIRTVIHYVAYQKSASTEDDGKKTAINTEVVKRLLISLLFLIIYYVLLRFVGFVIPTVIFIIAMLILLTRKVNKFVFIFAIAATEILFVAFRLLLQVPLPTGVLGF